MLAGYLPFDDDPANPEGDNINLLYKYIVNTPLTFPEYVTPHARDLLRRILVPNPRKRADLFEVARHSWLSEYAHVVEFITSSTTSPKDIQNTTVPPEDVGETPVISRSASVRETSKRATVSPTIGGLSSKQGTIDPDSEAAFAKQQRDNKRRTVQVEYVAPNTATQRGHPPSAPASAGRPGVRSVSHGAAETADTGSSSREKPLPRDPPVSKEAYGKAAVASRRPPSAHRNANSSAAAVRTGRETRVVSDAQFMAGPSSGRPPTGGSMHSTGSRGPGAGKRSSYSQPVPPEVADTNAHGKIEQPPRTGSHYGIPSSTSQPNPDIGRPSVSTAPKFARISGLAQEDDTAATGAAGSQGSDFKGHKRSSTMGEISGKLFGRSGSLFGGRNRKKAEQQQTGEKIKKYPPVSMNNTLATCDEPRASMDSKRSRRSFTAGLGKKPSGSITGSQNSQEKHARRFSFIPAAFSFKAIGTGKEDGNEPQLDSQQDLPIQEPSEPVQYGRYVDQNVGREHVDASTLDGMYAQLHDRGVSADPYARHHLHHHNHPYGSSGGYSRPSATEGYTPSSAFNTGSDPSVDNVRRPAESAPQLPHHHHQEEGQQQQKDGFGVQHDSRRVVSGSRAVAGGRGVLQKNKRFTDAWGTDSHAATRDHSGSSGPARRVMDFFRRRAKARGGEMA